MNSYNSCNIQHNTVVINRKEAEDKSELLGKIGKGITEKLNCKSIEWARNSYSMQSLFFTGVIVLPLV